MPASPRVVAIVAARNEADVIAYVLGDLIAQGVSAYLLDDGSTDETVARAEPLLGRGLLAIEHLPPAPDDLFDWERILRRKEALAADLDADWFIHHDADELREAPWADKTLAEAIGLVDRLGYDALDFEVLDFWPTDDGFVAGGDLRAAIPYYALGRDCDRVQVRCWKKQGGDVDLVASGGHDAFRPGRRVFPLRFLLRHYPFRTQAQAERKVFAERAARVRAAERARGWHHQYDTIRPGFRFVRDPGELLRYDADAVRVGLALEHRGVEDLRQAPAARERARLECERTLEAVSRELDARNRALEARTAELEEARTARDRYRRRAEALESSLTWRWSAPLRRAVGLVRGR